MHIQTIASIANVVTTPAQNHFGWAKYIADSVPSEYPLVYSSVIVLVASKSGLGWFGFFGVTVVRFVSNVLLQLSALVRYYVIYRYAYTS